MIKASAMTYAVMLLLLIALFCAAIIWMANDTRLLHTFVHNRERVLLNTYTGASLLLDQPEKFDFNHPQSISLEQDTLIITQKKWGIFNLGLINAFKNNYTLKRAFLFAPKAPNPATLYLTETDKSLKITGKTILKGSLYIPERGIERAYIEDKNFEGDHLFYGTKEKSSKKLPLLKEKYIDFSITEWLKYENYTSLQEIYSDSIFSFHEPISYFFSAGPLYINDISLKGNLIIHSTDSIIIGPSASLENIILISPRMRIEENFKGNFQAYVTEKMVLEPNVHLQYPSVILLNDKDDAFHREERPLIELNEKATLLGGVLITTTSPDFRKQPLFKIASGAEFVGFAYIDGQTELSGSLLGSLYTKTFYLKTKAASYTNHLVDAKIDGTDIPDYFLFPNWLDKEASSYENLKWLN